MQYAKNKRELPFEIKQKTRRKMLGTKRRNPLTVDKRKYYE